LAVATGLLTHADPNVRLITIRAIEPAEKVGAAELLLVALKDENVEVRDGAALALGRRAEPNIIHRLAEMATRQSDGVAAAAVFALQRAASPDSLDALLRVLATTESLEVRVQAIESVGLLGVDRAAPVLRTMLGDRRPVTTLPANERGVWRALAGGTDRGNVAKIAVRRLADGPDKTVADYATEALRRIDRNRSVSAQPTSRPSSTPSTTRSVGDIPRHSHP
jgi:hypothetical protein